MKLITRRNFITKSANIGIGCSLVSCLPFSFTSCNTRSKGEVPLIKNGVKQLFADDVMIAGMKGITRRVHAAKKLDHPVLEADMPWEQGEEYKGKKDRRVYVYGSVMHEKNTGVFKMWYNRLKNNYYATSQDGINWQRPNLGQLGNNNMFELFGFHSPSFICDELEPDPAKRYKAIGSAKHYQAGGSGKRGYCAAYSGDGLQWKLYPKNPVLSSGDTITLAQDPVNGEYLAFHKRGKDPRVTGRQVFLSTSKNMQDWTDPEPVMVTDETDHQEARLLEGGTHAEIYNMSAFPYGGQWLGLITLFRRTGAPKVEGPGQSGHDGPIDIRLVHSRDGRNWERCSDRSPVIPLGPYPYDSGSILGLCNSPVIVGDEMWMYYTAMTTTHGGYLPGKVMSIARAAWRIDGMVSLQADNSEKGMIETLPIITEGGKLFVNADVGNGKLLVEVADPNGKVLRGYKKEECKSIKSNAVKQLVQWGSKEQLPKGKPICLHFYLENGDLYSYVVE